MAGHDPAVVSGIALFVARIYLTPRQREGTAKRFVEKKLALLLPE